MGQGCASGCAAEPRPACACVCCADGACEGCMGHDEVIVGTEDGMRGVLRFRASGSRALPEDFQTELGRGCYLGTCSTGAVVRSLHVASNSIRALKRISKKLLSSSTWRADVEMLPELEHPHICKTYDAFEDSTSVYLVMELCKGGNLLSLAKFGSQHFSEAHIAVLVYQMVQAVVYLHSLGLIHCDLCPENWLFERALDESTKMADLSLKLIDFGLAQKHGREPPRKPTRYSYPYAPGLPMTERRTSRVSNTSSTQTSRSNRSRKSTKSEGKKPLTSARLFCQAPEQLDSSKQPCPTMDVWAIGILAYFLLLGTSPFEPSKGVTDPSNNLAFMHARYVFMPTEVWRHISTEAKSFIALCLEKLPENRPEARTLLSMPWMRMAQAVVDGDSLPMSIPEKVPQEQEPIAPSSADSASTSPRSTRNSYNENFVPAAQMAQSNVQRFWEYQALEKQIIIALAHEAKPQQLQQLRRHVEELDFERSGFVLWVVLLSCVRQTAPALSELEVEIPEVAAGVVDYNIFLKDVERFQKNMQESALWYAFSALDHGRGEGDRRQVLREIGDSSSMLHECILANFPGIPTESAAENLQQLSGSRVKFEDLLYLLQSVWQEGKQSNDNKPFSQRF